MLDLRAQVSNAGKPSMLRDHQRLWVVNPKLQPKPPSPNGNRTLGNGQGSIGLSKDIDQIDLARYGL